MMIMNLRSWADAVAGVSYITGPSCVSHDVTGREDSLADNNWQSRLLIQTC
jgi:hypothetical protein